MYVLPRPCLRKSLRLSREKRQDNYTFLHLSLIVEEIKNKMKAEVVYAYEEGKMLDLVIFKSEREETCFWNSVKFVNLLS